MTAFYMSKIRSLIHKVLPLSMGMAGIGIDNSPSPSSSQNSDEQDGKMRTVGGEEAPMYKIHANPKFSPAGPNIFPDFLWMKILFWPPDP